MKLNENTKVTLTIGQLKKLLLESDDINPDAPKYFYSVRYKDQSDAKLAYSQSIDGYKEQIMSRPDVDLDVDKLKEILDNEEDIQDFLDSQYSGWDSDVRKWWNEERELHSRYTYMNMSDGSRDWDWSFEVSPAKALSTSNRGSMGEDRYYEAIYDIVDSYDGATLTINELAYALLKQLCEDFIECLFDEDDDR